MEWLAIVSTIFRGCCNIPCRKGKSKTEFGPKLKFCKVTPDAQTNIAPEIVFKNSYPYNGVGESSE